MAAKRWKGRVEAGIYGSAITKGHKTSKAAFDAAARLATELAGAAMESKRKIEIFVSIYDPSNNEKKKRREATDGE